MLQLRLLSLLLLLLVPRCSSSVDHGQAMIQWIQSQEDGFVSSKLEIRPMFPNGHMGVFCLEDIQPNEIVLKIPRRSLVALEDDEIQTFDPKKDPRQDIQRTYYGNNCRLAHKLLNEWRLHERNASAYAPYLAYLKDQPTGQIPATYTATAKAVLRRLSGSRPDSEHYGNASLPPWQLVDWIDENFVQTGCIEADDELGYHAVAIAIQRGADAELLPLWDMINHHNGKKNIEHNSVRCPEGVHVWATDTIRAGQELLGTYNYCQECYNIGDDWGTPGMYRDFGFVEDYPQVWPFLDHKIWFEVDVQDDGSVQAEFYRDEETGQIPYGLPDQQGLAYLQAELERLTQFNVDQELQKLGEDWKPHELDMIEQYHRALLIALTTGIDATKKEWDKMKNGNECIGAANPLDGEPWIHACLSA